MAEHSSYFHDFLGGLYCKEDGQEWPCLHNRQLWEAEKARAIVCLCSHSEHAHQSGGGFCSSAACGCLRMRPKGVAA